MTGIPELREPEGSPESSRSTSPSINALTRTRLQARSTESLQAHPLGDSVEDTSENVQEPPESLGADSTAGSKPSLQQTAHPSSYAVNYRPRQRPPSVGSISLPQTSTATSITSVPATPGSPSSVTAKLQIQSLQASLRKAGLVQDSLGSTIVNRLSRELDAEWDAVLAVLKSGKAALLLPKETGSEAGPKLVYDHIILKDGRNIVTLSGIRGIKDHDSIAFTSCVLPIDPQPMRSSFIDLLSLATPAQPDATSPSIALGEGFEVQIPLQARAPTNLNRPNKPPPKRSLASLFGGQRPAVASGSPNSSPRNSVNGGDGLALASSPEASAQPATLITVQAFVIEKALHRKKLAKAVQTMLESRTRSVLAPIDEKLCHMTTGFLKRFQPSTKQYNGISPSVEEDHTKDTSTSTLLSANIETVTSAVQEFLYDARIRLEAAEQERQALAEILREDRPDEKGENTTFPTDPSNIDEQLEIVEALVCETLYDKLFSPPNANDRQEDESLSTRIAGLHILDLTLDHLGMQIEAKSGGPAEWDDERRILREGLEDIVAQCGKELSKLQDADCRTPQSKLNVLIQVHKLIANSLEMLPPIPMKRDTPTDEQANAKSSAGRDDATMVEMQDDAKSLGGRSNRVDKADEGEYLEKTPRLPSSRPVSNYSSEMPSILLPEASLQESYGITPSAVWTEQSGSEGVKGQQASYFDSASTTSAAPGSAVAKKSSSTTSADAILPLLIYSVVQANPSKLVSHVLFVQRFRADSLMRGEGEYCLCNMEAVRSFLMSCDLGSLGLGTAKLVAPQDIAMPPRIRHRAGQQIDSMVGSAGKVLYQAADLGLGGYRMLGGLLTRAPLPPSTSSQPKTIEDVQNVLAGTSTKANYFRDSILRRSTISSMVPSLRGEDVEPAKETELADDSNSLPGMQEPDPPLSPGLPPASTISSRLAALPGLSRLGAVEKGPAKPGLFSGFTSSPLISQSSQESLPIPAATQARRSTISTAPDGVHQAVPIQRFLESDADDLTIRDVALLLADYKRLAAVLREKGSL